MLENQKSVTNTRKTPAPALSTYSFSGHTTSPLSPPPVNSPDTPLHFVNITEEEAMNGFPGTKYHRPPSEARKAARRDTHNAAERQRRGNLTKHFLTLSSLLYTFDPDRRQTRSDIVDSTMAHIRASRRHAGLASEELRAMQNEAESLRREANEWREQAGMARLEEPWRDRYFQVLLLDAELSLQCFNDVPVEDNQEGEEVYSSRSEPGCAQDIGTSPEGAEYVADNLGV
ncbi:hypothetical protein R3P38DRAFT_2848478, partial [Favolaschia claudopus]